MESDFCALAVSVFLSVLLDYVSIFLLLGFVGYAPVIADIIGDHEISDTDDDQLYYTKIYLDEAKRVRTFLYMTPYSSSVFTYMLFI